MAGKEMLLLCATMAMERSDDIKVQPPPEIAQMRKHAAELRAQGDQAKAQLAGGAAADAAEPAAANEAAAEPAGGGGLMGMMGGALAKAADAAQAAGAAAGELAGKGIDMVCKGIADSLDKAVDAIEAPMTTVGKTIVTEKKEEIKASMLKLIGSLDITSKGDKATTMCRGAEPHGAAEYAACPGDSVSAFLVSKVGADIEAELMSVVGDAVRATTAVKAWDAAITQYNALVGKMEEMKMAKPEPIQLDLPKYIVAQTVASILDVMGKEEAEVRRDSAKERTMKPEHPVTFSKVFSGASLNAAVYAERAS